MRTGKRSAEEQNADEANRKTLNPNAAKQKISDGQANPEFQENLERLKAERLAREAGPKSEGEMSGKEKSTDPGLSAGERKDLRSREAKEALADHEEAQRALQGNLERLREERLASEAAAGPMLYPAPELPDDTPIQKVRFSTRIRNALNAAGMETIGDVREVSDAALLSLPDFGSGSLSYLREALGLPSTDGVRPKSKKPT